MKVGDSVTVKLNDNDYIGTIKYLGDTKFAGGEWAGVELKLPLGKNNGTVKDELYFTCEDKYGIFVRPAALKIPECSIGSTTSISDTTESNKNEEMKSIVDADKVTVTPQVENCCDIGCTVQVRTGAGYKKGIVRFIGSTVFSEGEWYGIELSSPVGKNNGSVGDNKYFECEPNHGLFVRKHMIKTPSPLAETADAKKSKTKKSSITSQQSPNFLRPRTKSSVVRAPSITVHFSKSSSMTENLASSIEEKKNVPDEKTVANITDTKKSSVKSKPTVKTLRKLTLSAAPKPGLLHSETEAHVTSVKAKAKPATFTPRTTQKKSKSKDEYKIKEISVSPQAKSSQSNMNTHSEVSPLVIKGSLRPKSTTLIKGSRKSVGKDFKKSMKGTKSSAEEETKRNLEDSIRELQFMVGLVSDEDNPLSNSMLKPGASSVKRPKSVRAPVSLQNDEHDEYGSADPARRKISSFLDGSGESDDKDFDSPDPTDLPEIINLDQIHSNGTASEYSNLLASSPPESPNEGGGRSTRASSFKKRLSETSISSDDDDALIKRNRRGHANAISSSVINENTNKATPIMEEDELILSTTPKIGIMKLPTSNTLDSTSSPSNAVKHPTESNHEPQADRDQRKFLYLEIWETEKQYVNDLEILISVFLKPLEDAAKGKKPILDDLEIKQIFSSILPNMLDVNKQLLEKLVLVEKLKSQTASSPETSVEYGGIIYDGFLKIMPFFSMYSGYFSGYEKSLELLPELRKSKPGFEKFLKECLKDPQCRQLDLGSFLIKPVQRICKYPLFFKELLKHTPEDYPNRIELQKANDMVQKITSKVNSQINENISLEKLVAVASKLELDISLNLVQPRRKVLLELNNQIVSYGSKKSSKHWIIVLSDIIIFSYPTLFSSKFSIRRILTNDCINDCYQKDVEGERAVRITTFNKPGDKKEEIIDIFFNEDPEGCKDFELKVGEVMKSLRNKI